MNHKLEIAALIAVLVGLDNLEQIYPDNIAEINKLMELKEVRIIRAGIKITTF